MIKALALMIVVAVYNAVLVEWRMEFNGMDFHGVWWYSIGDLHVWIYQNSKTTFIYNFIDSGVQTNSTNYIGSQSNQVQRYLTTKE